MLGPDGAQVGPREVRREELHSVLALRQVGAVHVGAEARGAFPFQLLRHLVDVPFRRVRRMARQALCGRVVDGPATLHGRGFLALAWFRARAERLPRVLDWHTGWAS